MSNFSALIRAVTIVACSAFLAGCQAVGSGAPPPRAVAAVTDAGFKAESFDEFNKNLDADDIVTTGLYACAEASCGGLTIVLFGRQTDASGTSRKDLEAILAKPGRQGTQAANRILRDAGIKDLVTTGFRGFTAASGGKGYVLDFSGKIAKDRIFGRLTMIYDGTEGRAAAAFGEKREVVHRFAGRTMLE
jgi:hypothetical protein